MRQTLFIVAGVVAALGVSAAPAAAQVVRTFVSGHGSDTGICGVGAPCRTFAYAITQTAAGGEITVLDPAGYGAVFINEAISIVNDGVGEAGVTATSGSGIVINAAASDVVNLRGLTLVGTGSAFDGILLQGGGGLNVQNCVIRGFQAVGIDALSSTAATISIIDTIVSNNGNGIFLESSGSSLTASLTRIQVIGNETGLDLRGLAAGAGLTASVEDSVASNNTGNGFEVQSAGPPATLTVVNSAAVNNPTGLEANGANATMVIAKTTLSGNSSHGFFVNGGVIKTYGNNSITDVNNLGSLTSASVQ
jgi:hypothetical protein